MGKDFIYVLNPAIRKIIIIVIYDPSNTEKTYLLHILCKKFDSSTPGGDFSCRHYLAVVLDYHCVW